MDLNKRLRELQNQHLTMSLLFEELLSFYDPDYVGLLEEFAVPHYFNITMIRSLRKSKISTKQFIARLTNMSFVSQDGDKFQYHEIFRNLILRRLLEEPTRYEKINLVFSDYYKKLISNENSEEIKIQLKMEILYHSLGSGKKSGTELLRSLFDLSEQIGSITLSEKILGYLEEQSNINPNLRQWLDYYSARLQIINGNLLQCKVQLEKLFVLEIKDEILAYLILHSLGMAYGRLGDVNLSIEFHEKALRSANEFGNINFIADEFYQLGRNNKRKGEFSRAIIYHKKSLQEYMAIGNKPKEGEVLLDMGNVYTYLADWERAEESFVKSYNKYLGLSNFGCAIARQRLGWLKRMIEELDEARELHLSSIKTLKSIGAPFPLAEAYHSLGLVYRDQKEWDLAYEAYELAIDLFRSINALRHIGIVLKDMSYILFTIGKLKLAAEKVNESIHILHHVGDKTALCDGNINKSLIMAEFGYNDEALKAIESSLIIAEDNNNKFLLLKALDNYAYILWKSHKYDSLYKTGRKLLNLANVMDLDKYKARGFSILTEASIIDNRDDDAIGYLFDSLGYVMDLNGEIKNQIKNELSLVLHENSSLSGGERLKIFLLEFKQLINEDVLFMREFRVLLNTI